MPWITETFIPQPKNIVEAEPGLDSREFIGQASQGTAFRWRDDFHKAKSFLMAVSRRIEKRTEILDPPKDPSEAFHRHRQNQASRARVLSRLLIPIEPDFSIKLSRAPEVREAIAAALEHRPSEGFDLSLRELLGMIGAHEWRRQGVPVLSLDARIIPHYGVFSPVRGEYLDLVGSAPLPPVCETAFDIGTGTGVIAAILAHRGVGRIVATDTEPRALRCAAENLLRLGFVNKVELQNCDFFPAGKADLIVCNPPWIPARATSRLENAIFDLDSQMLKGFLKGVPEHLSANGEAWLILSDLAEHLGLRSREELLGWIEAAGLRVVSRLDTQPRHPKSKDKSDPLFQARSREVTSLWRVQPIT